MTIFIKPIQEKESDAVYQMFQDIPAEENDATNHANGLSLSEFGDFCKLMNDRSISTSKIKPMPEGKIPQTMYIIFEDNIPVGFGKFRPFLNEACIKNRAGHLAYMISPKHRRKGYATAFVAFIKDKAKEMGLHLIEGTVLESNVASCRVLEKNGAKIKERVDGDVVYTIEL